MFLQHHKFTHHCHHLGQSKVVFTLILYKLQVLSVFFSTKEEDNTFIYHIVHEFI